MNIQRLKDIKWERDNDVEKFKANADGYFDEMYPHVKSDIEGAKSKSASRRVETLKKPLAKKYR